jgi:hypothetical protein
MKTAKTLTTLTASPLVGGMPSGMDQFTWVKLNNRMVVYEKGKERRIAEVGEKVCIGKLEAVEIISIGRAVEIESPVEKKAEPDKPDKEE